MNLIDFNYQIFLKDLNRFLKNFDVSFNDQGKLLNLLIKKEKELQNFLFKNKILKKKIIYGFLQLVLKEKKRKSLAIVFLRERQDVFYKKIAKLLNYQNGLKLANYRFNYVFFDWVHKNFYNEIKDKNKFLTLFEEIKKIRNDLCSLNVPLAINRAKIFWSKAAAKNNLEFNDLVQMCCVGLLNAIDKYVPPYRKVFASTIIGRMTAYMLESQNSAFIKNTPLEKKILYYIRTLLYNFNLDLEKDINFVTQSVYEKFGKKMSADELKNLVAASEAPISLFDSEISNKINNLQSNDFFMEQDIDFYYHLTAAINDLSILEKKVLLLKFGNFFEGLL